MNRFSVLCVLFELALTFSGTMSVSFKAAGYVSHGGFGSGLQVPPSFVSNLIHY